jgi:type III secretion protein V
MLDSLKALPIRGITRHPDILLAVFVALTVALLIIPLPTLLLDALISFNISLGLIILMVALFAKKALDVGSFPSILLITTLFRLGLNVSTTRQILLHADAGEVVRSFGQYVVQGDLVVGIVVFLVITIVQFIVIAKGAERVAEVGARFTLDAMPGKQMSIDAALRQGSITDEEAEMKRDELGRESQLFGNLDGAMKFIKGDAIAALILAALNLIAGFAIGVTRNRMSLGDAAEVYSILSIGDGLVSQIPALLITLSSGVIVTRVENKSAPKSNLGADVKREFFGNFKVLGLASGMMLLIALVPGLPTLPFLFIGASVGGLTIWSVYSRARGEGALSRSAQLQVELKKTIESAEAQKAQADRIAPSVIPIGIDLDPELTEALGLDEHVESAAANELLSELVPQLRDALYLEMGVRFPGVRVRGGVQTLPPNTYVIRVKDVPVHRGTLDPSLHMAMATPDRLSRLGITAAKNLHPVTTHTVSMVPAAHKNVLEASGIAVWSPAGVIALELASVLRHRAKEFLGLQEVGELVERMELAYPTLAKEVVPKVIALPQLVGVLRRLVEEGVCIRDLKTIFEALGEHGRYENDEVVLTERVRAALASQLAHAYAGQNGQLKVVLLDPEIEDTIRSGIQSTARSVMLALEPEIARTIIASIGQVVRPIVASGARWPALLVSGDIRRLVRKLVESDFPRLAVLSYEELPGDLPIHPLGRATLVDQAA